MIGRPRIRRSDFPTSGTVDARSREAITEIGWPRFHLEVVSNFHTWKGEETRTDRSVDLHVGPTKRRGIGGAVTIVVGAYPDTDEEGWPQ